MIPEENGPLKNIKSNYKDTLSLCETMNYLSKVKIKCHVVTKNGKEINETFKSKNGIVDLLDTLVDNPISKTIYVNYFDKQLGMWLEAAFTYDPENKLIEDRNDGNHLILSYANFCTTVSGGTHVNGLKSGIANYFTKYVKENILNKKELKELTVNGEDARNDLVAVIHLKMENASFVGQMKEVLGSPEAETFVQKTIVNALKQYEKENPAVIKKLGNYIRDVSKIRNKNKDAKKLIVEKNYANILSDENLRKWSGKCSLRGKVPVDCIEVYVVEGDSADVKGVMDKRYQESINLRGVPKNGVGVPLIKMMDNEEAKTIITVCTDGKKVLKNIEDCPIGKLIISSDADKLLAKNLFNCWEYLNDISAS